MFKKISVYLLLFLIPLNISLAYFDLGKPTGFINDYTKTLSLEQKSYLEQKLSTFEKETSNEIFAVVIQSLQGDSVENFANQLFNTWGIGKKGKNNGVLFLVALDDRRMRIEVGYGLEPYLTDAQSFQLIDKIAKPSFRNADYFGGMNGVLDGITGLIKGTYSLPIDNDGNASIMDYFELIFFFGYLIIMFLASVLGSSKSWWAGGVIGLIIGIILGFIKGFNFGIWSSAILFPVGLLFDLAVSKAHQQKKESGKYPWWAGGGSGGFGGGFGGGGGGSSGGGGASGGW